MLPRRHILLSLLAISFFSLIAPVSAGVPSGNHLIMVTASDCPWCEAFEDEVGRGYPNTEEAKLLPLRRYDFYDPMPTDMVDLVPATMTPTEPSASDTLCRKAARMFMLRFESA